MNTIKNVSQFLALTFGTMLMVLLVAMVDSLPMWVLLILAILFWMVWLIVIIRERRAGVKLKVMIDGEWVLIEDLSPEQTARHLYHSPSPVQLFDQDRETQ